MSQHVTPGGKKSRQQAAAERLEKHLANHPSSHSKDKVALTEDEFKSHDKCQKEELKHIQGLLA